MALLGREPDSRSRRVPGGRAAKVIGALTLVSGAGCMLIEAIMPHERAFAFSHRIHVEEEGLECINCHEDLAVLDEPGMPAIDTCLFCHEELDAEKPPERRVETLFDEDEVFRSARVSRLDDEVIFAHLRHVDSLDECSACHRGIDRDERIAPSDAVLMEDCTACHEDLAQPSECATCHTEIGLDWTPGTHEQNWKKLHGRVFRAGGEGQIDSCYLCHSETTCARCHMQEAPDNHNNHWRLRGHSIAARIDRDNCAACHQPADCDRCHSEVLPMTHKGMWGGTKSMHCLVCHFPLRSQGCFTCHKDAPSHLMAPPKPAWHNPAMNCTQCHGTPSLPLSHVEKGDNCNICHL